MNTTAQRICTRALRIIGAIGIAETVPGDEIGAAKEGLDTLLDGWRTESLLVYVTEREIFDLVSGQQRYTIGPGANFNRQTPAWLKQASVLSLTNPAMPQELPIDVLTLTQWQNVPVKNVTSTLPTQVYYDQLSPIGNLDYFPIPNQVPLKTVLYCMTSMGDFADLTTVYDIPRGYARALVYNLAIELAPEYAKGNIGPDVMRIAMEAKANIKRVNLRPVIATVDKALTRYQGGRFNWLTGEFM